MFKNLKDYFENKKIEKLKKQEQKDALNKEYPTKYCFYGRYDKEVIEDDIKYTYSHTEVFFANSAFRPTSFKRLTGDDLDKSEVVILEQHSSLDNKLVEHYVLEDNDIQYKCMVADFSHYAWDDTISLGLMSSQISNINAQSQREARDEHIAKIFVEKEFEK